MKNNFFMCSLMAFCLFSLQTINTSESKAERAQKRLQNTEADARARIEEDQIQEQQKMNDEETKAKWFRKREEIKNARRKKENQIEADQEKIGETSAKAEIDKQEAIERFAIEKQFTIANDPFKEKVKKEERAKDLAAAIKKNDRAKIQELEQNQRKDDLKAAIMNNDAVTIEEILKRDPLIVGEMVPDVEGNLDFRLRDFLILYGNARGLEIINEIADNNLSLRATLDGKFSVDFKSIPLDALAGNLSLGNLESDVRMLKAAMHWNVYSSDLNRTKEGGDQDFNAKMAAHLDIHPKALLEQAQSRDMKPVELKKAGIYERMMARACAMLTHGNIKVYDPNQFPWFNRNMPALQSANGVSITKQNFSGKELTDPVPRIVFRPEINIKEVEMIEKILKKAKAQILADVESRKAQRMEAQRIEVQRIEVQKMEEARRLEEAQGIARVQMQEVQNRSIPFLRGAKNHDVVGGLYGLQQFNKAREQRK